MFKIPAILQQIKINCVSVDIASKTRYVDDFAGISVEISNALHAYFMNGWRHLPLICWLVDFLMVHLSIAGTLRNYFFSREKFGASGGN